MGRRQTDPNKIKYFESRAEFVYTCRSDEKEEFVKTTFIELMKDGWTLCTNGKVASCIEKMIPFANSESVGLLLKTFTKELQSVLNTKFAHHVLHAALRQCVLNPQFRDDLLVSSSLDEYLAFMWENYMTLINETHSSPALRVYVQLLTGVNVPKSSHSGLYDVSNITLTEPLDFHSYKSKITELVNVFLLSESFNIYVRDAMSCAFLQVLLIICSKRMENDFEAICSTIIRRSKLLKTNDESEKVRLSDGSSHPLPMGFSDPVAVFFTETLISLLPGRLLQKFLEDYLLTTSKDPGEGVYETEQLSIASALSSHENACRVLRAAIRSVRRAADIESIMAALQLPGFSGKPGLKTALESNQHYLLISLAKACRQCSGLNVERVQNTCDQMLQEAFGFSVKSRKINGQIIKAFVQLKPMTELERCDDISDDGGDNIVETKSGEVIQREEITPTNEKATSCQLAGCLLAEEVFGFTSHRPIRLAASLASLPPGELFAWSRNTMLHRVIESALLSPSVPYQRKIYIFESLKSFLKLLATDQSGSRIVEALWRSGDVATSPSTKQINSMMSIREELAKALAPASNRLATSKFGRFVENLVSSAAYAKNPRLWREAKLNCSGALVPISVSGRTDKGTAKGRFKRKLPTDFRKLKRLKEKQNKKAKRS